MSNNNWVDSGMAAKMNKPVICHYCEKPADLKNDRTIYSRNKGYYFHASCLPEHATGFERLLVEMEIIENATNFSRNKIKREDL